MCTALSVNRQKLLANCLTPCWADWLNESPDDDNAINYKNSLQFICVVVFIYERGRWRRSRLYPQHFSLIMFDCFHCSRTFRSRSQSVSQRGLKERERERDGKWERDGARPYRHHTIAHHTIANWIPRSPDRIRHCWSSCSTPSTTIVVLGVFLFRFFCIFRFFGLASVSFVAF